MTIKNLVKRFAPRPKITTTTENITLSDGTVIKKTTFHGYNV